MCIEPLHWAADLGLLSGVLRPWQSAWPAQPGPGSRCHWRLLAAYWHWHDCQAARAGNAPHDDARPAPLSKGRHCAGGGVVKPRYCPASDSESGTMIAVTRSRLTSSSLLPSCKFDFEPTPDRWS